MSVSRWSIVGLIIGVVGSLAGISVGVGIWWFLSRPPLPKDPLTVHLDEAGPYLILATQRASKDYATAIRKAKVLHPKGERFDFDPNELGSLEKTLKEKQPRYALVFIETDEIDVNFAWRWLTMTTRLDDDPFVDVRTGFITGATPNDVEAHVTRIAAAVAGELQLPGLLVDDLGPPEQGGQKYFNTFPNSMFLPVLKERFNLLSISHGKNDFTDERLDRMAGAGLVHFGGHGHPDRIDDGLTAGQLARLKLSPCVVFNGACYTGVTHRWFDVAGPTMTEKKVDPDNCFCLNMLRNQVVAYLAAVHPDHGMPVYQEMEFLAYRGASLGNVIKHTHDGVVIGAGGKLPALTPLKNGAAPERTAKEVMLKGTAARLLFGDPALVLCKAFTPEPFTTALTEKEGVLYVTATLANPGLLSTFTNTFTNNLNQQAPFNDRARIEVELPEKWKTVGQVKVLGVKAGGQTIPHQLVGQGLERDQGILRLHVQVDVPAQGFQQSAFRAEGATVELEIQPLK